ncbi:MAG: hypothetical protein COB39_09465 [Marinosulfonomonas sp.]|nr:MAG: hypothetical protein COB39_09465 [Marinosulfonomonas sp.]
MKHTPTPAIQADPSVTEIEFCAWVAQALPGDRLEYHRGFLVLDTFPVFSSLEAEAREALRKLADRTFHVAEQGLVHLVQERVGPDCFAYIAVARPKPKSAPVSLSALLLEEEAA